MVTLPKRFEKMADPLIPVLTGTIDMAAALGRIEQRLGAEANGDDGGGKNGSGKSGAGARKRGQPPSPRA
jgi:hypothetical protein